MSKSVITSDFETRSKAPPMRITKIEKKKLRKVENLNNIRAFIEGLILTDAG